MNKFEQLIEYVINDEENKARELFHDIVVAKSREIYENLMAEEELDEESTHRRDDRAEKAGREVTKDIEYDEEHRKMNEEEMEEAEEMEEGAMGGDAADDLIDEVETDEQQYMSMEAEDDMSMKAEDDMADDDMEGSEPATKDDIMNLDAKLDELMAEFEAAMGDDDMGDGDDFGADEGGDAIEVDDTEEMIPMAEAVSLKAAPKPVTSEEGSVNKKSNVAANAGAKGPVGSTVKPVHATGTEAKGRPAPTTKPLISDFQNKAGTSMKSQSPATKPHLAQATGVNTTSPLPSGR